MKTRFFYLTQKQIHTEIDRLFARSHKPVSLRKAILNCYDRGEYSEKHRNNELFEQLYKCTDEEFLDNYRQLSIEYDHEALMQPAQPIFAPGSYQQTPQHQKRVDVYVENVFYHTIGDLHTHENAFEVLFVYHGVCHFSFENQQRELHTGDFCIIAPGSRHDISVDGPDDFVIQQYIFSEHFRSSFVKLLEDESILSHFFKMILTNQERGNYLLFSTPGASSILQIARNLYLEQFKYDEYSPSCTFFWMQLLFSNILREGIHSYQLSADFMNADFTPVLDYLQKNYKTATLSDIAAEFHYSVAYLSTCIKKMTGSSYSTIVRDLKMKEAAEYLLYTNRSIDEISVLVGYHSADHFSRVFRSYYGKAPSDYRSCERR